MSEAWITNTLVADPLDLMGLIRSQESKFRCGRKSVRNALRQSGRSEHSHARILSIDTSKAEAIRCFIRHYRKGFSGSLCFNAGLRAFSDNVIALDKVCIMDKLSPL